MFFMQPSELSAFRMLALFPLIDISVSLIKSQRGKLFSRFMRSQ